MKVSNFNPSPHRNINCLGHDLKDECKKRAQDGNNWTETELVVLYRQLVKFLVTLNERQSLHRRINPKAIVFKSDNKIKLTNFDSISVDKEHSKTITRTSAATEDSQFVAPEYGENSHSYSSKVDVFSTGIVMMYMATAVD